MKRIGLVPTEQQPSLSIKDGQNAAQAAFFRAKDAQMRLVSNLGLTSRLHNPGTVTYFKLKGMQRQAQEQADRAQEVANLLAESLRALEAIDR